MIDDKEEPDEVSDTMNLSALIKDNEKPEVNQKTSREEDIKHKSFFWLGVCACVGLLVAYMELSK